MKIHFEKEKDAAVSPEFVKTGMEICYKLISQLVSVDPETNEKEQLFPGGVNLYIALRTEEEAFGPDDIKLVVRRKKYKRSSKMLIYADDENQIYVYQ